VSLASSLAPPSAGPIKDPAGYYPPSRAEAPLPLRGELEPRSRRPFIPTGPPQPEVRTRAMTGMGRDGWLQ